MPSELLVTAGRAPGDPARVEGATRRIAGQR
jgi:hypothetical protein